MSSKKQSAKPVAKTNKNKIILTHEERSAIARIAAHDAHVTMLSNLKKYDRDTENTNATEQRKLAIVAIRETVKQFPRLRARYAARLK
jgi:hypothetical protein